LILSHSHSNQPPPLPLLAAAVELRQRGLSARDIAQALGLTARAVEQMLGEQPAAQDRGAA
jgi:predicted transcriptional regulator